ncbi:D-alanine transaminase [Desulfotomaculum arcticum]|uniref:D-alanine aminotransferase n=1 Tax=Desulfotruncus arcticus DSM 17038 TaxID=1121424 RepID=A0A1I2Y1C7_9FIRM|nr:D-amino-acid transaminase [Desulfotruncus arcticus]SFH18121.1 D-alanine transaminase [Desulfotomaculum arcticum] [Desulfotruncus arcticus DSM 17038]
MQELVYLNGWTGTFDEATISVNDRGFNFGDGIYEVVRVYESRLFAMDDHLDRLERSAKAIDLDLPWQKQELTAITEELLAESGISEAMVYIQVSRGTAHRNHIYNEEIKPNILVTVRSVPERSPAMYQNGVKLITQPEFRWQMCHVKSISLLGNVLAKNRAHRAGAAEAVFVHPDGTVTECSASNIFIYSNGQLLTHPADNKILAGITRKHVLAAAESLNLPFAEKPFKINELMKAEEVFFTGTIVELVPVVEVDGQSVAGGKPGPVTAKLHQEFTSLRK